MEYVLLISVMVIIYVNIRDANRDVISLVNIDGYKHTYKNQDGKIIVSNHNFVNSDGSFDYEDFYYYHLNTTWR